MLCCIISYFYNSKVVFPSASTLLLKFLSLKPWVFLSFFCSWFFPFVDKQVLIITWTPANSLLILHFMLYFKWHWHCLTLSCFHSPSLLYYSCIYACISSCTIHTHTYVHNYLSVCISQYSEVRGYIA